MKTTDQSEWGFCLAWLLIIVAVVGFWWAVGYWVVAPILRAVLRG